MKNAQKEGDILVHVESFERSERFTARLSFSTKIVDYFEIGKCILAVGWKDTAAIEYLKEKDAAYVITEENQIKDGLSKLLSDKGLIFNYAEKSYNCGKQFHNKKIINERLLSEIKELSQR